MNKSLLTLIFFGFVFGLNAQQTFEITNNSKSKTVKQTDYFTFYLDNGGDDIDKTNLIYEGYILSAVDGEYEVKVFFEEYESYDTLAHQNSLIMDRCSYKGSCDKVLMINNSQLKMFQHNKRGNISGAKFLFSFGAAALVTAAVLEFNADLFTTNGVPDIGKRRTAVFSTLGVGLLSVGVGLDLVNPKKYYVSEDKYGKKGGWYIK